MNVKVDENLPVTLVDVFVRHGHDAHTVMDEGLTARPDDEIAECARTEGRILVTLDRGFGNIRAHPPGTHPGIIVLRPDAQRTFAILELVSRFLGHHDLAQIAGCNVIVQPNAVRIRRPA